MCSCYCNNKCELIQKIKELEDQINQSVGILKMYKITLKDYKATVVCEQCYKNGEIKSFCDECGGKGIHNKTKQRWELEQRLTEVVKIDKDEEGYLRYWTDKTSFYSDTRGQGCLFFNKEDALKTCKERNRISKELKETYRI